ncbi:unnamed protein product [Rhodiola kirilowii]
MKTTSLHDFGGSSDSFSITIIENMKPDYGLFVWPCSVILAEYVYQQRSRFSGAATVVELGAGTSLPGLVAAKLGCDVTLTDEASKMEVLDNMRMLCNLNNLNCKILGLTWGVWDESVFELQPRFILGADVLYDASAFDNLFATVAFMLQSSPGSCFITTYHNRSGHHLIEFLMMKWGLKCVKLLDAKVKAGMVQVFSFIGCNVICHKFLEWRARFLEKRITVLRGSPDCCLLMALAGLDGLGF